MENKMKFDVVIGNPPYNDDLYLDFVQAGYEALKDDGVMVMITPAKWQAKRGKKNEDFRANIVPHMKEIVYYKDSKDVFDIGLSGGLSIFSVYAEKLLDEKNITIVNGANHENVVMPFVGTLDINDAEIALLHKIVGSKIKRTNKFILKRSFICVKIAGSTHTNADKLAYIEQKGSGVFFRDTKFNVEINKAYLTRPEELGYYHLLTNVWIDYTPRVDVYNTNEVSTDNNFCIYKADSIDEIKSAESYFKCKLIWWLIARFNEGCNSNENTFRLVPDPGAFDHIFTDYGENGLYKKYGLTQDEINIIESAIKERK